MEHALANGLAALGACCAAAFGIFAAVWSAPYGARPKRAVFCTFGAAASVAVTVFAFDLASRLP